MWSVVSALDTAVLKAVTRDSKFVFKIKYKRHLNNYCIYTSLNYTNVLVLKHITSSRILKVDRWRFLEGFLGNNHYLIM